MVIYYSASSGGMGYEKTGVPETVLKDRANLMLFYHDLRKSKGKGRFAAIYAKRRDAALLRR